MEWYHLWMYIQYYITQVQDMEETTKKKCDNCFDPIFKG